MATSDYRTGTVSIAAATRTLAGAGTAWLSAGFREGDTLFLKGYAIPIESVENNASLTLSEDWPGADVAAAPYRMRYQSDLSRMSAKVQALIDGLSDLKGARGDKGDSFSPDATGVFADRAGFDAEAEGFSFLSLDGDAGATTGEASVFIRRGAAGGWSDALPFRGPPGADAAVDAARDGGVVVANAASLDFQSAFEVTPDPGDPTRAAINIFGPALIQIMDGVIGRNDWRRPLSPEIEFEPGVPMLFEPGVPMSF